MVDVPDLITYSSFGDHRLRVFWVAGGQISPFPIDFHRRPYNTPTLPRECVITQWIYFLNCNQHFGSSNHNGFRVLFDRITSVYFI